MMRASLAVVAWPKVTDVFFVVTAAKFVWLNRLNVSARNCRYMLSPRSLVFLKSDKSQRWKLGPVTTPRPRVPGTVRRKRRVNQYGMSNRKFRRRENPGGGSSQAFPAGAALITL